MLIMANIILDLISMGKSFRAERKALGLTQAEVAKKSGLRRETIIQIESGENVSAFTLIQATAAIGKCLSITDRRFDYDSIKGVFDEF